ncbi:putative carotenoid cleavage dioxygenase 4, chloroplastic [Sesamum alatum]|uniref:Carotenoid cleavage dioxygenase 4, chloroplastic n=1 Tax=Sesamum alatum TaxID=300844 RepID=A0AAE1YF75_9LAMI|nr:putative carotenoid cleavage dioxygenase 4, chloroplastic [Sesamum alatum]
MEVLSSSFLPKFPDCNLSSVGTQKNPQTKIIVIYSFTKFHEPIMKLISNSAERTKYKTMHIHPTSENKREKQMLLANIFKSVDDFISSYLDLPLSPSIDPKHVLFGNFSPVDELPPTPCQVVEGSLPSCLDGVYLRNGPNTQFIPRGPYHLFDGDGMLHMIKISNGKATFCSRYVKTYKYMVERGIGHSIFPSIFSSFNGLMASMARVVLSVARVLTRQFNPVINGFGTANTSVALISGKLYALGESDLPYEIEVTSDGDIITIGRHDFYSGEPYMSMTAHPKIDPDTGETFAFRFHVVPPRLTFFRIGSDGRKGPDMPVFSMKSTALIHDFAVTKNYIIFNDGQMMISPLEILRGRSPVKVDSVKVPRLGVMDRYATDENEMWWIDVPGFNMSHAVNAWEEDDGETLVLVASIFSSVELVLDRLDLAQSKLEEIRISVTDKKVVTRHPLSTKVLDMAVINPAYAGKKNRYAYAAVVATPMTIVGVVKLDLSLSSDDCIVASRIYEPGCTGNEPFFVPNNPAADEDDGFLVTYVHDEKTQESKFLVMDAKSPTLEIVAAVKLPGRVPTGFHGLFLSQSHLEKLCRDD